MNVAGAIAIAMVLDAVFGEPGWLWSRMRHPAVLIGNIISWLDRQLNTDSQRKLRGVLTVIILIALGILLSLLLRILPATVFIETILAAILLAHKSLTAHVADVATALRLSLDKGRKSVAKIVGRDTRDMDEPAVVRGAIESAAENLSDGVIAPVFWFLIAGFPGMLIYKIINTADSMIGYKNQRYEQFGWAAARLDDVLNWVPARMTAALIALAHLRPGIGLSVARDARLHRSPNAGWPEAAMAICLNISLAGPRSYDGEVRDFPYVHPDGESDLGPADIDRAVTALWKAWVLTLVFVLMLAVV
ncbi:MAG: adenosylcobinamide-phosphate synthase CbiB [Paracoccaceae bacterium]